MFQSILESQIVGQQYSETKSKDLLVKMKDYKNWVAVDNEIRLGIPPSSQVKITASVIWKLLKDMVG